MKYSNVRNPKWVNAEHTALECEVLFDDVTSEEWSPFGASPNDPYPHGREIHARIIAGEFGEIAEYVPPPAPKAKIVLETDTSALDNTML